MSIGYYGTGPYGLGTFGGINAKFEVAQAVSLNPYTVVVEFNQPINVGYPPFLDIANYVISGLTVTGVTFYSATSVALTTIEQSYALYTVLVVQALASTGLSLDPLNRTATFTGSAANSGYVPIPTAPRRIRLVFAAFMERNVALTNVLSYQVKDLDGSIIPVMGIEVEQPLDVLSLVLVLGSDLTSTDWYVVGVDPAVVTVTGVSLVPPKKKFQWVDSIKTLSIPLTLFTGELQGGLFGNPDGQVFFSPALDVPQSNSIIQIEEVDVCTTAYDRYLFPVPVDPRPLYTWQATGQQTTLGQVGVALWAPFPRLAEAIFSLAFTPSDTVTTPYSGRAEITVAERWDKDFISLLNNTYWGLGPTTATPAQFIAANNLAVIPPGPSTTTVIGDSSAVAFGGSSDVSADLAGVWAVTGSLVADSDVVADVS